MRCALNDEKYGIKDSICSQRAVDERLTNNNNVLYKTYTDTITIHAYVQRNL